MGWAESGQAWGERAADWAYLFEPYARRANDALFDRAGVGPGTRLLDIACGSGYAASVAAGRGATVAAPDASEALIAIARARTPSADFRVGDMFALPFGDDHFDVATSFNGIWKGCEDALREARRVVRPGGLAGSASGDPRGGLACCRTSRRCWNCRRPATPMPPSTRVTPGGPAWPSRCSPTPAWSSSTAERRRSSTSGRTWTWPPGALASAGPSWPAVQAAGYDRFTEAVREAIRPCYADGLGVRIVSEFGWIMGRVPGG
jgi:SAM-dependent methyltransferase